MAEAWYQHPIHQHARAGGERGANGVCYAGGEFMPFYVPRPQMPQVDEADYDELFAFADARGVTVIRQEFEPHMVRAHQRVDRFKVEHMSPELLLKPALVSIDLFVLDGNHRWSAHVAAGTPLPAFQLGLEFEAAIGFLFDFPKTYRLTLETPERN